jgi:uncharacterized membrane protein
VPKTSKPIFLVLLVVVLLAVGAATFIVNFPVILGITLLLFYGHPQDSNIVTTDPNHMELIDNLLGIIVVVSVIVLTVVILNRISPRKQR